MIGNRNLIESVQMLVDKYGKEKVNKAIFNKTKQENKMSNKLVTVTRVDAKKPVTYECIKPPQIDDNGFLTLWLADSGDGAYLKMTLNLVETFKCVDDDKKFEGGYRVTTGI